MDIVKGEPYWLRVSFLCNKEKGQTLEPDLGNASVGKLLDGFSYRVEELVFC